MPEPTVARDKLLLLHVPPEVALLSVVVRPGHTDVVPVISATAAFIVTSVIAKQPALAVYVILATPVPTAVTRPVLAPTVATDPLLLLHVPPAATLLSKDD